MMLFVGSKNLVDHVIPATRIDVVIVNSVGVCAFGHAFVNADSALVTTGR